MHYLLQTAVRLVYWVQNPFNLTLLIVAIHELRVIRHRAGEHHLIGFNEQGLDLMAWFATAFCVCTAAWLNRFGDFWPAVVMLCVLVLLRGLVLLYRYQVGQRYITYSRVSIAERTLYAFTVLVIGSMAFVL